MPRVPARPGPALARPGTGAGPSTGPALARPGTGPALARPGTGPELARPLRTPTRSVAVSMWADNTSASGPAPRVPCAPRSPPPASPRLPSHATVVLSAAARAPLYCRGSPLPSRPRRTQEVARPLHVKLHKRSVVADMSPSIPRYGSEELEREALTKVIDRLASPDRLIWSRYRRQAEMRLSPLTAARVDSPTANRQPLPDAYPLRPRRVCLPRERPHHRCDSQSHRWCACLAARRCTGSCPHPSAFAAPVRAVCTCALPALSERALHALCSRALPALSE
jgi:hypothetical protein